MANRKRDIKQRQMTPNRFGVGLSCGHVTSRYKPLPILGSDFPCVSCGIVTVILVDSRERVIVCPICGPLSRFHVNAKVTADTAAAVHNIREKRGHKAIVTVEGGVSRADPHSDIDVRR